MFFHCFGLAIWQRTAYDMAQVCGFGLFVLLFEINIKKHTTIVDRIWNDGRQHTSAHSTAVMQVCSETESHDAQWHILCLQLCLSVNLFFFKIYEPHYYQTHRHSHSANILKLSQIKRCNISNSLKLWYTEITSPHYGKDNTKHHMKHLNKHFNHTRKASTQTEKQSPVS